VITSKKGGIGLTLTWMVAFLIIFFLMLVFLGISSALAAEKKVTLNANKISFEKGENTLGDFETQRVLFSFLNSEGEDGTRIYDKFLGAPEDYPMIQGEVELFFNSFETSGFQVLFNFNEGDCIFDCGTTAAAACAARGGLTKIDFGNGQKLGFCFYRSDSLKTTSYSCRERGGSC